VRIDPKFAHAWAVLSVTNSRAFVTQLVDPSPSLREEAQQAAETALSLQPNLGEALLAKGFFHYGCLKDYDAAVRYFEEARQLLPNNSRILESLAYVARRRGEWERSEALFNEAERLDPRNAFLLTQHALSYRALRQFDEAQRKLDQALDVTPTDPGILAYKANLAQAEGDLSRAAEFLGRVHAPRDVIWLTAQAYQTLLERRPASAITLLMQKLALPERAPGSSHGHLWVLLAWAQQLAGDPAGAEESWRQARNDLEPLLIEQPDDYNVLHYLALAHAGLGDKAAAFAVAERAVAANPIEKDALGGPFSLEILARVAAQTGEPDRAIAALEKVVSVPGHSFGAPLTPALLRLDPMFDPLRGDPRFEKVIAEAAPKER
jgi:serine/threonine-protein kinase